MEKQLPKNWVECTLSDVFEIVTGNTPSKSYPEYYGEDIPWVKPGDINRSVEIYETEEYLSKLGFDKSRKIPKGSVMVTCIGNLGNIAIAGTELATNQQINTIVISHNLINKKYVYYRALTFKKWLVENSTSTTIAMVNKSNFEKLPFLLPPLPEQTRIVAKLDTLFAQLETIKASMANIPFLLKDFRQQVLTQAVTGKLTEEWRKGEELENMFNYISKVSKQRNDEYEKQIIISKKEKLKKPKKDFDFDFKKHPIKENWCIAKLDNLVYMSARIGWKGLKAEEYTEFGPLFISVHSLNYGENVNYEKAYHISEERFLESPEIMLEENDILLCKDGAGIGKIGIVKNLKEKATVNSSLLVIRGREVINSKFLFYFFSGPTLQNIAKERITGTAIPHLFQRDIREFYVEIPPLEEQQEIVSRVESLFAKADTIEQQYKILKQKIDTLPQALLHKAFKGELTEQLESDGDARELLKQIQQLKGATTKVVKNEKLEKLKSFNKKIKNYSKSEGALGMVAEGK